jgi:hypothetical protein
MASAAKHNPKIIFVKFGAQGKITGNNITQQGICKKNVLKLEKDITCLNMVTGLHTIMLLRKRLPSYEILPSLHHTMMYDLYNQHCQSL